MPLLFQKQVDKATAIAVWKIEEAESFFLQKVALQQNIHHPHKRLQHLAGRYLLALLVPHFPFDQIEINQARKPYLLSYQYRFSISHCGDYAAAIVSSENDCGIDIELISSKTEKVKTKFLSEAELRYMHRIQNKHGNMFKDNELFTIGWCAKEAVYKWWGNGKIDFRQHIRIQKMLVEANEMMISFKKETAATQLHLHLKKFGELITAWTITSKKD